MTAAAWSCLAGGTFADVDGDGFPDFVYVEATGTFTCTNDLGVPEDPFWIRNTGGDATDWFTVTEFQGFDHPLLVGVEADELADRQAECAHTGPDESGFLPSGLDFLSGGFLGASTHLADVNGDGLADLAVALHVCWDELPADGSDAYLRPAEDDVPYSQLFYGDGQGGFVASGLAGGRPFIRERSGYWEGNSGDPLDIEDWLTQNGQTWTLRPAATWGIASLEGSGHLQIIDDAGATDQAMLSASFDAGLEAGFGLEEDYGGPTLGTLVPGRAMSDPGPIGSSLVVADFDADGFADFLDVQHQAVLDFTTADDVSVPLEFTLTLNPRTVARGRVTRIHEAWGGVTEPVFAFTDLDDNPDSAATMEVISSVTDEDGTTTYAFSDGYWWASETGSWGSPTRWRPTPAAGRSTPASPLPRIGTGTGCTGVSSARTGRLNG